MVYPSTWTVCQVQVEAVSHEKHGGVEGLEEHQQRLLDQKLQERIKASRAHACCVRNGWHGGGTKR